MLKTHFFKTNNFYKRSLTTVIGFPILAFLFVWVPILFCALLLFALMLILIYEWPLLRPYASFSALLKTVFYPILPFFALIFLYLFARDQLALLWGYVCVFDTTCYLVGNLCGETPITTLSPKKTWEGLIGGIVVSEGVLYLIYEHWLKMPFHITSFLFFLCVAVIAFSGDLFESWLKRNGNVKDSGSSIPGHGGLLDRLDSILFVAASYLLYTLFFL